jgi:hypothetical protein
MERCNFQRSEVVGALAFRSDVVSWGSGSSDWKRSPSVFKAPRCAGRSGCLFAIRTSLLKFDGSRVSASQEGTAAAAFLAANLPSFEVLKGGVSVGWCITSRAVTRRNSLKSGVATNALVVSPDQEEDSKGHEKLTLVKRKTRRCGENDGYAADFFKFGPRLNRARGFRRRSACLPQDFIQVID